MKFNKLFFAAVAFAALAMVGCKKPQNEPIPTPDPTPDPEIEMPEIAAPAAGQTTIAIYAEVCPAGAYLVGTANGWAEANDSLAFEAIEGAEHWYKLTVAYAADFQGKVLARPSDPDVAKGWSYQWGKNYDPEDANCELKSEEENNVILLTDKGEFTYENGGQPKLINIPDGDVVYIQIKNWAASPVIEAKKLETCWVKSNFNGLDWAWYEMTPKGDGVFEFEGIWGGNGCNINAEGADAGSQWYPNPELIDEPKSGDKVLVTFVSEKMVIGQLSIKLLEKGQHDVIPAGEGTFVVSILNREYAEGDHCIFTGNFEEKSWGDSDREMTYDANTGKWSWTGAYPEDFQYKVIYNGSWATGENVVFDGETFEAAFEIQ